MELKPEMYLNYLENLELLLVAEFLFLDLLVLGLLCLCFNSGCEWNK